MGTARRLPRAVDAVHALRRPTRRRLAGHVAAQLDGTPAGERYEAFLDEAFTTYGRMYEPMATWFKERHPKQEGDSDFVYRQTILAKTCDTLRVLLPAGTRSNLGIYATGQSYEQLLMRLAVHPLAEMREYGELMKVELRKVIPEFLKRVDVEERGCLVEVLGREPRAGRGPHRPRALRRRREPEHRDEVTLVDFDPEGETKIAAVLYWASAMPDDQLLALARSMPREQVAEILRASVGDRSNRRHKPGRSWSARVTASTCCATTVRSATCSGTARSRSSGSGSPPNTGTRPRRRSTRPGCAPTGNA